MKILLWFKKWLCLPTDFSIWLGRTGSFSAEVVVTKAKEKNIRKVASTARNLGTSLLIFLTCRRRNLKKNPRNQLSNSTSSESRSSRV